MKSIRVITLVCWIVTAVVLCGLVVWFLTGTTFGLRTGDGGWSVGLNSGGWESLSGPFEEVGSHSVDPAGLNSIKVNWVAGEITVKPHDGSAILITEFAQRELRENEKLRVDNSGGTLTIRFRERNFSGRMPQKRLEVLVPRELSESLHNLSVDTVSGDVNIESINAAMLTSGTTSANINATGAFNAVDLGSVSGRITLSNSVYGSAAGIETVSGAVSIAGSFNTAVINSVSGSITAATAMAPSSFKVETVSGSVTITMPDGESVSVSHSSVSGRFSSEVPVTMESRGAQIEISTVSGSATIKKG
jgi:DUF4097 and DUF4098 domain-containing protein YvlB